MSPDSASEHAPVQIKDGRLLDSNTRMTLHAEMRWNQRVPEGSTSPETAWYYATDAPGELCERIRDRHDNSPDRLRVYKGLAGGEYYRVVFVCSNTPNPFDAESEPEAHDAWTNVVTCYLVASVPSPEVQCELSRLVTDQEVVM